MIIIVLGSGIDQKGRLSKETINRLKEAHRLHLENGACFLLSGKYNFPKSKENPPRFTEAEVMLNYLKKLNVKEEKIFIDKESTDTISAAYFAKTKHFIPQKEKKATIVTSGINMERVEYIFFKVFGEEYQLHLVATTQKLSCQSKGMIFAKQKVLNEKAKKLLEGIESGDHEAVKKRISSPQYEKEKTLGLPSNLNYKKTC